MENILLSIIIPTRGRLETLKFTLEALIALNNKNIEILVCDNASNDGTEIYVNGITDSRVRYFKSETPLTMPQNFERGLVNSKGDYVLTLGDDDLIIQNNLNLALKFVTESNAELLYWNRWYFYWSSYLDKSVSGTFGIPIGKKKFDVDATVLLTLAFYGFLNYQYLPSIYNSIVKKSFLLKYKLNLRDKYFPDYVVSVDVFSSLIFSSMNPNTQFMESPVSISGISHRSNGMSVYNDGTEYNKVLMEMKIKDNETLIPKNLVGKIKILTINGKNTLGLMVDYYNAIEMLLKFSMNSPPSLDLFTKNFISKLVKNKDIEIILEDTYLNSKYSDEYNITEDPATYFYKVFNIPLPNLYTGRFNNIDATSLNLFEHLQEINFNYVD